MTFLALLAVVVSGVDAPPPSPGYASSYAPGVFTDVVRYRFEQGWWRVQPPADWYTVAGYVATTDCDQVGEVIELRPAGATQWQRALVADCVGDWLTLEWMLVNSIDVELNYELWRRWGDRYGLPLQIELRGHDNRVSRLMSGAAGVASEPPHVPEDRLATTYCCRNAGRGFLWGLE